MSKAEAVMRMVFAMVFMLAGIVFLLADLIVGFVGSFAGDQPVTHWDLLYPYLGALLLLLAWLLGKDLKE